MISKLKSFFVAGLGLLLPFLAIATPCTINGSSWNPYSNNELGVAFCYPSHLIVQTKGNDIYIQKQNSGSLKRSPSRKNNYDLLFNGKSLADPNDYIAHFRLANGSFAAINKKEAIFIRDKGVIRADIGRFNNPEAHLVGFNGWSGYKTEIVCSVSDSETGFHAAGGLCLWIVASNGQRTFILETQGDPANIPISFKIAKSLRFLPANR